MSVATDAAPDASPLGDASHDGAALAEVSDDAGFSLTELAVYILVVGIISAIVAASVLSLFRSEETVSSLTNSANESQIFVNVLNQDLRSAREFAVRDEGTTVVASVATKTTPVTWSCVTWAATGTGNDRTITRNGKTLLENARPAGSAPFFATDADVTQGSGGSLAYDFRVATSDSGIIEVRGTVSNEAQGDADATASCI